MSMIVPVHFILQWSTPLYQAVQIIYCCQRFLYRTYSYHESAVFKTTKYPEPPPPKGKKNHLKLQRTSIYIHVLNSSFLNCLAIVKKLEIVMNQTNNDTIF